MKLTCSCRNRSRSDTHENTGRRALLGLAAFAVLAPLVGGLAGCSERADDGQSLAAVEFTAATACELDGMLLADYPGPKAQILYAGARDPVYFCDTVEMFNMLLRPEQVRKVLAVYVQDMGRADWERPRGQWMDAKTGVYVVGSKRHGSMGPTVASFSQEADAKVFVEKWGGKLLRFSEVTPELVDLSGGALHDTRM